MRKYSRIYFAMTVVMAVIFLFNFYIYTKNEEYVISTLDKEYEGLSFKRLMKSGKVDNSYIVMINVCKHCGSYSIEIEEFEV